MNTRSHLNAPVLGDRAPRQPPLQQLTIQVDSLVYHDSRIAFSRQILQVRQVAAVGVGAMGTDDDG